MKSTPPDLDRLPSLRRLPQRRRLLRKRIPRKALAFLATRFTPLTVAIPMVGLLAAAGIALFVTSGSLWRGFTPVANQPQPESVLPPSEVTRGLRLHRVAPGETVEGLATTYGVDPETIRWANGLDPEATVVPDQEIVVPTVNGVVHLVVPGQTLRDIADLYGVSVEDLATFHAVTDPDAPLQVPQLVVPGGRPLDDPRGRFLASARGNRGDTMARLMVALPDGTATPDPSATAGGTASASPTAIGNTTATPTVTPTPTSTATPTPSPTATPEPTATPTPVPTKPKPTVHVVAPGETISGIAERYGIRAETILASNGITDPDYISEGDELVILPVDGVMYEVQEGDSLDYIARLFQVDLGPIVDFNEGLENVDLIQPGQKLIIPGAKPLPPPTPTPVPPPTPKPPPPKPAPPTPTPQPEPEPEVQTAAAPPPPAEEPPPPPAEEPPPAPSGGRGDAVANFAMKYLGYPYVWGAAGPRAFDCSGFVYYVYRQNGVPISRGLWGQLESGQRVSRDALQPGDIVFFQNTYMAGLSHNGIYLGGGQFIHAVDPSQGVKISSLNDPYWASRWFGASRP